MRWLLEFDEQPHADHVIRDLQPRDKNSLSVSSHRHVIPFNTTQRNGSKQGSSEPTGTLYLYNQNEFYSDMALVCIIIWNILVNPSLNKCETYQHTEIIFNLIIEL